MNRAGVNVSGVIGGLDRVLDAPGSFLARHPRARGTALGMLACAALAAGLIPIRDSIGTANIALSMAIIVGIVGSRHGVRPGVVTAVWASALFTLLHAVPHGLPRIEDEQDAITAVLLVAAGAITGAMQQRRRAMQDRIQAERYGMARLHRLAEAAVHYGPIHDVITAACDEIRAELHLRQCFWDTEPKTDVLRELGHNGVIAGTDHDAAPEAVAELLAQGVFISGAEHGRFVLLGRGAAYPVSRRQLKLAVIMADLALAAIQAAAPEG